MKEPERTVARFQDDLQSPVLEAAPPDQPQLIGRYRVIDVLGKGEYGQVYLAHDDQLKRDVAIKVPRVERLFRPEDTQAYLIEARTVAGLDHPNIVPIFDFGTTPDGLCYLVSKVIEGCDLARKIRQGRPSYSDTASWIATVAEALHYAHGKGLVHRDIKPGNILIDNTDKPYVADFGLALREEDFGKGGGYAGTPAYMSPEQARGEGHRVDGRSDIFSLGVVFYELLVGRRPFKADLLPDLMEQITKGEPSPPRQVDADIPRELERICLKALAKRASERYSTAREMADDLCYFLRAASAVEKTAISFGPAEGGAASLTVSGPVSMPTFNLRALTIIPKGLRSFDAQDADFFLELLPGPRDRDGLPESIRFWKTRIEETDPDHTFSVGLIYGPSGCGKSSLMKAGLLPRLADSVIAVYVEATAQETEARLLKGLRKYCPDLPEHLGLIEALAGLRRGHYLATGKKVVIVLDQFEQWLHAKKEEQNTELVQALRQCDGGRLQCIVMVRDDFWMAVTRFLTGLEIELLQGRNCAAADLFDLDHARKVLEAFGRAFGKLPLRSSETSWDQTEFLDQAVAALAQEGKIMCVRLALFAEMMKSKTWTPGTLKAVGGTAGVGVIFLEDTFSSPTANPRHRLHQDAARGVLKALLPESGTDIKGHMRSYGELLEASGYEGSTRDFDDLIRILDGDLRLITPTDPEGKKGAEQSTSKAQPGQKYYQLTHDYLVLSLRDWLTRKQKETKRGRAELLLADRAGVWNARPEKRQLPSLLQWLQIRTLTAKKHWTPPQRKMMWKATWYHAVRVVVLVTLVALIGFNGYEGHGRFQAIALRSRLLDANTNEVPTIVADMASYRRWINPLLYQAAAQAEVDQEPRKQLHASLGLLPVDATQVDYLYGRLLDAEPNEVAVIRDALAPHKDELLDRLWAVVESPPQGKEWQRLRAASALAKYDPQSEKWARASTLVVHELMLENAVFLGQWSQAFWPVKGHLLSPLSVIFRDHQPEKAAERALATNLLADYAADQPEVLAKLLMDADEKQFAILFPKLKDRAEQARAALIEMIDQKLPLDAKDETKEQLARRQVNAAVALLRLGQPEKVWPFLKHSPDPRVRSYLIHRLSPLGADANTLANRLKDERDVTIRRALLLSLGEFSNKGFSPAARQALLPTLQEMYCTASDPGLHAASEWLLRTWKQEAWLKQTNDKWAKEREQRQEREEGIKNRLAKEKDRALPQWYVNGEGQTMVVIPGPVTFLMGSPLTEAGRYPFEPQHRKRIGRTFAIAAKLVTLKQYREFDEDYKLPPVFNRAGNLPVVGTSWYQAAAYCNWLSKEEGIDEKQWCYEGKGKEMNLRKNYLSLTGYRLPTEAEMEYATRAGALTSRFFGETEDLLPKYAWYFKNSQARTWPVGSLKPNDLGLFDVHGNLFTWCQESYTPYPEGEEVAEDQEDELVVKKTVDRVLRGGSYKILPADVRSASRSGDVPVNRNLDDGFRVARTFAP